MKHVLLAVVALTVATPVISIPVVSEGQVLTGSGASRRVPRRPRLSEAEIQRLAEAEDQVVELDFQIADIEQAGKDQEGLTEAQQAELEGLTRRREEAQATVDRLEAKRNR